MHIVQIDRQGPPEVLDYRTVATPEPGPGEALVRVEAAAVNAFDLARRSGASYPFPTPLPFVPGGEIAGVVERLGEGVDGPAVGTPVFALVGGGEGGYAQYVTVPAAHLASVPDGVALDRAATLPVAGATALLMLREVAALAPGESVLVPSAAGGVGRYALQVARLLGAGTVLGSTTTPAKRNAILAAGADAVLDATDPGWPEEARERTGGRGVDVVLEMSGDATFARALRALAPFGRLVVYGMRSGRPLRFEAEEVERFFYDPSPGQSLHAFNLGLWLGRRPEAAAAATRELADHLAAGRVDVDVAHHLPLARAADAHRMLEQGRAHGKIVLEPWRER